MMKQLSPWLVGMAVLAVTGLLTLAAPMLLRDSLHYQQLTMVVGDELQLDFVKHGVAEPAVCKARLAALTETLKKTCPACRITASACAKQAAPDILRALASDPLDVPSSRLADGTVTYRSASPGVALASCAASERQTATAPAGQRVRCFAAGVRRSAGV